MQLSCIFFLHVQLPFYNLKPLILSRQSLRMQHRQNCSNKWSKISKTFWSSCFNAYFMLHVCLTCFINVHTVLASAFALYTRHIFFHSTGTTFKTRKDSEIITFCNSCCCSCFFTHLRLTVAYKLLLFFPRIWASYCLYEKSAQYAVVKNIKKISEFLYENVRLPDISAWKHKFENKKVLDIHKEFNKPGLNCFTKTNACLVVLKRRMATLKRNRKQFF